MLAMSLKPAQVLVINPSPSLAHIYRTILKPRLQSFTRNRQGIVRYAVWDVTSRCPVSCRLYRTAYSSSKKVTRRHSKWLNHTSDRDMADSVSGSPDSYSSFLVTIHLSRLVSEIFACDRQITWTITIAGPHIVVGQLKMHLSDDCSA